MTKQFQHSYTSCHFIIKRYLRTACPELPRKAMSVVHSLRLFCIQQHLGLNPPSRLFLPGTFFTLNRKDHLIVAMKKYCDSYRGGNGEGKGVSTDPKDN